MRYKNSDLKFKIALSYFSKFGPRRLSRIFSFFRDSEAPFRASPAELARAGIEDKLAREFVSVRGRIDPDSILDDLEKESIQVLEAGDERYPRLLKELHCPPALLFAKGRVDLDCELSLAVVGARKHTAYGRRAATELVENIAGYKLSIISGLALGIDTIAHEACLKAGGHTIAVLGSGLDRASLYPASNRDLARRIVAQGGAVISEFPPGTPPWRSNFPQRNRIIAGLSLAVLVIEAGEKSGALITARYALDQNRDIFALPGSIYSEASRGPNRLIQEGARPILSAADIAQALDLERLSQYIDNKKSLPASADEAGLLELLRREPAHINELIRQAGLGPGAVIAALAMLEMKGLARNTGGMMYALA